MVRTSLALLVIVSSLGCAIRGQSAESTELAELAELRNDVSTCHEVISDCYSNSYDAAICYDHVALLNGQLGQLETELLPHRAAVEQRLAAVGTLSEEFADLIDAGELEVYTRNDLPVIVLPSELLFNSGKAELSKQGKALLSKVAASLANMTEQRFQIAGHTDNTPIARQRAGIDNWQLSTERALTVTRFLIAHGLAPDKLSAAGHGEHDPVASNDSDAGRKKNHRIELILLPNPSELPPTDQTTRPSN